VIWWPRNVSLLMPKISAKFQWSHQQQTTEVRNRSQRGWLFSRELAVARHGRSRIFWLWSPVLDLQCVPIVWTVSFWLMTFDLYFWHSFHLDHMWVRFKGQFYRSKFTVMGGSEISNCWVGWPWHGNSRKQIVWKSRPEYKTVNE